MNKKKMVIKAQSNGISVDKPLNERFSVGDYLMYHKRGDFFYNWNFANKYRLEWDPRKIIGYVANDEINYDNTNSEKVTMIELNPIDPEHIQDYYQQEDKEEEEEEEE